MMSRDCSQQRLHALVYSHQVTYGGDHSSSRSETDSRAHGEGRGL